MTNHTLVSCDYRATKMPDYASLLRDILNNIIDILLIYMYNNIIS